MSTGLVIPRVPVAENAPEAPAKGGADHANAAEVLRRIGRPAPRGLRRWLRVIAAAVVVVGAVVGAVIWRVETKTVKKREFVTVKVARGDLAATVTATGTLQGKDTVDVGAEISGKIKALHADYNDAVKKGQVLCEIDPEQPTATRNQAKAQLQAARAEEKSRIASAHEAQLAAERLQRMAKEGLSSDQQLESAVAAAARAAAAVEAAAAQITVAAAALTSAETALAKTTIRSPIDGVVLARRVEMGQTVVAAMQTPVLFTLARDLREMEMTVAIDEADIGQTRVDQGATFTVDAWPGRSFVSRVRDIHNVAVVRDNVVTYEARLDVANEALLLRPGMTATVTIETEARSAVLLVPNMALRFSPPPEPRQSMFGGPPPEPVVDSDPRPAMWLLRGGVPVQVRLTTGLTDGTTTEISGTEVKEGDLAVVDVIEAIE